MMMTQDSKRGSQQSLAERTIGSLPWFDLLISSVCNLMYLELFFIVFICRFSFFFVMLLVANVKNRSTVYLLNHFPLGFQLSLHQLHFFCSSVVKNNFYDFFINTTNHGVHHTGFRTKTSPSLLCLSDNM